MEKFLENLQEAEKTIRTADHLIYVTFPLVRDKKLLLKILSETKNAIVKLINSILQYEYIFNKLSLKKDPKENLELFMTRCAPHYRITSEEVKQIKEIFNLAEKHKQSPMEFVRGDKIVILSENLKQETITPEKMKELITTAKNILHKTKEAMVRGI